MSSCIVIIKTNYNPFVSGTIDYNFLCFKQAIQDVFEVRNKQMAVPGNNIHLSEHAIGVEVGGEIVNGQQHS